MGIERNVQNYFEALAALPSQVEVTEGAGETLALAAFYESAIVLFRAAHERGNKVMFVGNGGSAAIASHMATDLSKNGGIRSMAFNDAAAITCFSNDYDYDQVFSRQLSLHAASEDVLVAISSSGNSANILNAVAAAKERGCTAITMSGFGADNRLRTRGDYNVYVPCAEYGFVEIMHHCLCHAITDLSMGWGSDVDEVPVSLQEVRG